MAIYILRYTSFWLKLCLNYGAPWPKKIVGNGPFIYTTLVVGIDRPWDHSSGVLKIFFSSPNQFSGEEVLSSQKFGNLTKNVVGLYRVASVVSPKIITSIEAGASFSGVGRPRPVAVYPYRTERVDIGDLSSGWSDTYIYMFIETVRCVTSSG